MRIATLWLPVVVCLASAGLLATTSALQKSVTIDEYVYPTGLAILRGGVFHIDRQTTPLPKMIAAVPLLFQDARLDLSDVATYDTGWACGNRFAEQNKDRYHRLFIGGRMVSIAVFLCACMLTMGLARCLYGQRAMLLTLVLVCFSPNLIAHGRLVMSDSYLVAAIIAALWAFDVFVRQPGGKPSIVLGACLGTAALCKYTGVMLFILFPISAVVLLAGTWCRAGRGPVYGETLRRLRTWGWLVAAMAIGVLVINLGYAGNGSCLRLGDYSFQTGLFRALQRALPAALPVPLPEHFFAGMDAQLGESGYLTYLLGEVRVRGFPHFYLVALMAKLPLATLGLGLLAFLWNPIPSRREWPLVIAGLGLLLFFSLAGHKNGGLRYVLFLIPMLAVWSSRLLSGNTGRLGRMQRALPGIAAVAAALLAVTTVRAWPHYLPFFNGLAGGARWGHRYLVDSDLDFGQDLVGLKRFMHEQGIDTIDLAYYGRPRPELYGVPFHHLFLGRTTRYAAVSATLLWGKPYFVNGTAWWLPDAELFAPLRKIQPLAVIGHTIYVYDLDAPANRNAVRLFEQRRASIYNAETDASGGAAQEGDGLPPNQHAAEQGRGRQ